MKKRFQFCFALLLAALLWAAAAHGWSFAVCGDSRDDKDGVFLRLLAEVRDSDMEFLIHTGDIERPGGAKSWIAFKEKTAGFPKPLYIVIGNHEIYKSSREEFARFFGLPSTFHAFTHRNTRFLILDNAGGNMPDSTLQWLDKELGSHPKRKNGIVHIVVAMHFPPQTDNIFPHGTVKAYADQSQRLLGILSRHKVDLLLCGHEHMHMVDEWNGVKVIVSGGAGAPLVPFQRYGFYRIDVTEKGIREKFISIRPDTAKAR